MIAVPKTAAFLLALATALGSAACFDDDEDYDHYGNVSEIPTEIGTVAVTPHASAGPAAITLESLSPESGTRLTGCGNVVFECAERIRVRFKVESPVIGQVDYINMSLHHDQDATPCLIGQVHSLKLPAGQPAAFDLTFAYGNQCRTPIDLTRLVVVLNDHAAPIARQEWTLKYRLEP